MKARWMPAAWLLAASVAQAVPQTMTTSGRLLDAAGQPLSGEQLVTFQLMDGEVSVWDEQQLVRFENGYYAAVLGASAGIDAGDVELADAVQLVFADGFSATQPLHAVPAARSVVGHVQVTALEGECTAARLGTLSLSEGVLVFCDGESWQSLQGGASASGPDGTQPEPAESCLALYEGGHDRGDGLYYLQDHQGAAFPAYCDMSNGGWTLLAVDRIGNFGSSSAFWQGTLGSSTALSWGGESLTTGDLEKVVRAVPFTQLRLGDADDNWWTATFASSAAMGSKVAARTPFVVAEAGSYAYGCGWDQYFNGNHTIVEGLMGCMTTTGYGDRDVLGLGVRARTASGGASCDRDCSVWHTAGAPGPRGVGFLDAGNTGIWVK